MSDFLEKHGISLEKPKLEEVKPTPIANNKPRENPINKTDTFTFEDPIHFARFILTNQESFISNEGIQAIINSTNAYNRACCGDSRRNWQRIIDGFSREFLSKIKENENDIDKMKKMLNCKKIIYKSDIDFIL